MKYSLGISNFIEEISIVFPILLFSFISLHWSLRKAFLSLLAILWNSAFRWVYLSFSPLLLASLLFTAICKASSDNHFAFLHFFFLRMVLTDPDLLVSVQETLRCGSVMACCRSGGTECSSACMGPFEGGHHYLHHLHHVWPQVNNREGTQPYPST